MMTTDRRLVQIEDIFTSSKSGGMATHQRIQAKECEQHMPLSSVGRYPMLRPQKQLQCARGREYSRTMHTVAILALVPPGINAKRLRLGTPRAQHSRRLACPLSSYLLPAVLQACAPVAQRCKTI